MIACAAAMGMDSRYPVHDQINRNVPSDKIITIDTFERDNWGDWNAEGEAFGGGPALSGDFSKSERFRPMGGLNGNWDRRLVRSIQRSTNDKGHEATGTLASAPFKIQKPYIEFLVGGGHYPETAAINLIVGGKAVRSDILEIFANDGHTYMVNSVKRSRAKYDLKKPVILGSTGGKATVKSLKIYPLKSIWKN